MHIWGNDISNLPEMIETIEGNRGSEQSELYQLSFLVFVIFSQVMLSFSVSVVSVLTMTQLILVITLGIFSSTSKIWDAVHGWMLMTFRVVIL